MSSSQCIKAGRTLANPRAARTGGLLHAVRARVKLWHRRARDRRMLAQLDAHMLRDIGITREDALREARKPFWRE